MSLVQLIILPALVVLVSAAAAATTKTHEITLFGKKITGVVSEGSAQRPQSIKSAVEHHRLFEEQKKLYLDSKCYVDSVGAGGLFRIAQTSEPVKYLLKLKCNLKPLMKTFGALLVHRSDGSISDGKSIDFAQLASKSIFKMDAGERSAEIWREYSALYAAVDRYVDEAIQLMGQRDFCTYTTIAKFGNLNNLIQGSRLLSLANDLVMMDYHTNCLQNIIEKLPEVPYVVKDVVKMYIEGVEDTHNPNLNDPAHLDQDATGFDIDEAVRQMGPIEQVASLMLQIPSGVQEGQLKDLFRSECQSLLIRLEEQWQPMEMMNMMLATESNTIMRLNNMILRSLKPQKYAQICTQLLVKA